MELWSLDRTIFRVMYLRNEVSVINTASVTYK